METVNGPLIPVFRVFLGTGSGRFLSLLCGEHGNVPKLSAKERASKRAHWAEALTPWQVALVLPKD